MFSNTKMELSSATGSVGPMSMARPDAFLAVFGGTTDFVGRAGVVLTGAFFPAGATAAPVFRPAVGTAAFAGAFVAAGRDLAAGGGFLGIYRDSVSACESARALVGI